MTPINKELKAARIDLLKKGNTIVQTFHPRMGFFAGKGGEEGVRQFLNNYVGHVYNSISADLPNFMRATLLASIYFYLVEVLTKATGGQRFDPTRTNMQVQMTMLTFSETIFPRWGENLPEERFRVLLSDSKDTLRKQKYLAEL